MGEKNQNAGWRFFDAAYCISLASRPDRLAEAARQFARVGLQDLIEFIIVQKHPADNEQGIYESHLDCMARGLATGARHILIFEDDIVFRGFTPAKLAQSTAFLTCNPHCRLLFFGSLVAGSRRTGNPGILKVDYRALTHAYVIDQSLAAELVNAPWQGNPYDRVLAEMPEDKFALYPSFAFQSSSPSDNARLMRLDKIRRLCGGLAFIQKMNEHYHRHKTAIVAGHLALLAGLLWLVMG